MSCSIVTCGRLVGMIVLSSWYNNNNNSNNTDVAAAAAYQVTGSCAEGLCLVNLATKRVEARLWTIQEDGYKVSNITIAIDTADHRIFMTGNCGIWEVHLMVSAVSYKTGCINELKAYRTETQMLGTYYYSMQYESYLSIEACNDKDDTLLRKKSVLPMELLAAQILTHTRSFG
eukprot:scaffold53809_cov34-Attheya_sp.AAC.2